MTTPTVMVEGRLHVALDDGRTVDVDAHPPADHVPTVPAPAGFAVLPCRVCGQPVAAILARLGGHLLCLNRRQAQQKPTICGGIWHTLIPVYRGERPYRGASREIRSTTPALSGAAA